ncbi:MAG TPA: lipopolysaccharide kinase InaA family protein [Candidatus Accumulibacter phosphatis]|nr:MAG: lipopolysaccharide core heptose(I) kinase RfaP [Candidatus Accumulibacter sp. SK-11]HRL78482.1 lipopolysaccharide kinase InaA family protein [Candidatus Accumulibacter phosphatis]HRQ97453.1 lipopolysaccharide kinase InaA family protein [Candidatus Accumulibacter phosphatis]
MNARDLFPSAAARNELQHQQLAGFDKLWSLRADWHEAPNERRGGWSGVSRHVLADGSAVFVKRQQDHLCRTLRHPLSGIPTFYREYRNILRLQRHAIGTLEALYYGDRWDGGHWQAILVTRALDDFSSLDEWHVANPQPEPQQRQSLIAAIASACARLHHHRLQHSCLYGKHVFVRRSPNRPEVYEEGDVRFIDLEKLRRGISRKRAGTHDLDQLQRHTSGWGEADWQLFSAAYRKQLTRLRH